MTETSLTFNLCDERKARLAVRNAKEIKGKESLERVEPTLHQLSFFFALCALFRDVGGPISDYYTRENSVLDQWSIKIPNPKYRGIISD